MRRWEFPTLTLPMKGEDFQREVVRRLRNLTQWLKETTQPVSGWTAWTGTADRSTEDADATVAISNPPTQAEVEAVRDLVIETRQAMKALIDDLTSKGILGG